MASEEKEKDYELEEGEIDDDEEESKILGQCPFLIEESHVGMGPSNLRLEIPSPVSSKGNVRWCYESPKRESFIKSRNRPIHPNKSESAKNSGRNNLKLGQRSCSVKSRSDMVSCSKYEGASSRVRRRQSSSYHEAGEERYGSNRLGRSPESIHNPVCSKKLSTPRPPVPQPRRSEYSYRRQRLLATFHRKNASSSKSSFTPRKNGSTYEELLHQYQDIKSKLRTLASEEDVVSIHDVSSDSDIIEIEEINKENLKFKESSCSQFKETVQLQNLPGLSHSVLHESSKQSTILPLTRKEEDEQDIEMLRKIALASALKKTKGDKLEVFLYGDNKMKETLADITEVETVGENCEIILDDNYEEISMDLDSPPNSPKYLSVDHTVNENRKETPTVINTAVDIEDDEDILRAKLLSSLTNKQLEKTSQINDSDYLIENVQSLALQKPNSGSTKSQDLIVKSLKSSLTPPTASLQPLTTVHPPLHKPVVINLNEDSDSDPEVVESVSFKLPSMSSIDDLLNEARQKADEVTIGEPVPVDVPVTPTSVYGLPESELTEYRRLKAEIAKREQIKSQKTTNVAASGKGIGLNTVEFSAMSTELKACEQMLMQSRSIVISGESKVAGVDQQIGRKGETLKIAEKNVATLQKQLDAAIKIAQTQKQSLEELQIRQKNLKAGLLAQKLKNQKLEQTCLSLGKKVIGDSYGLPTTTSTSPKPGVKRKTSISKGIPPNVTDVKSAKNIVTIDKPLKRKAVIASGVANEKARLQEMREKIAKKLQELRMKAQRVSNKRKAIRSDQNQPSKSSTNDSQSLKLKRVATNNSQLQKRERKNSCKTKSPLKVTTSIPTCTPMQSKTNDLVDIDNVDTLDTNANAIEQAEDKKTQAGSMQTSPMGNVNTFAFDFHTVFMHEIPNLNLKLPSFDIVTPEVPWHETFQPYKSPLLHLKAYRFSPYFRTKANQSISWPTYSHKLIPNKVFCRFDLTGTCNDDKCLWQHDKDYTVSSTDILCDIVSYAPALIGCSSESSIQKLKEGIENYLDKLLTSNRDKMTQDELYLLLVGRVNEFLEKVPPHYITFDDRLRHCSTELDEKSTPKETDSIFNRKKTKVLCRNFMTMDIDPDAIVEENDVRYFHNESVTEEACESAIISDPKNTNMWIKFAFKKLSSIGCSPDLCLDLALNVLSRGLEHNQEDSGIWLHYLTLYSKRSSCVDLLQLCKQAVQYAPSYKIWWKYLQYSEGYENKIIVCQNMMEFVIKSNADQEVKSHQVLETILYYCQLNILTGRNCQAVAFLEETLGKSEASLMPMINEAVDCLTRTDKCLTWLCYIHLLEFQCLPSALFNSGNNGLGKLVCKKLFILPWQKDRPLHLPVSDILSLFMAALSNCVVKGQPAKVNVPVCLPLYKNLIALQLIRGRNNSAVNVCEQLMKIATLDEVWILMACVYFRIGNFVKVRETLNTALNRQDATPRLFCFAAMFELYQGNNQAAQDWTCTCIEGLYELQDQNKANMYEIEHMYCHVLGLPLPLNANVPPVKLLGPEIPKQKSYLWLNYCVYLIAQGRYLEVKESFEIALLRIAAVDELKVVWIHYLQFTISCISKSTNKQEEFSAFTALVHRCVTSVPCTMSLPGSDNKSWIDYSFYNSIVELYAKTVAADQVIMVYEKFVAMCPRNAVLATKLLDLYINKREFKKALYFCQSQLEILPSCLHLWKTAINLAQQNNRPTREIRLLYFNTTEILPYTLSLWQDFISFELDNKEPDRARALIDKCLNLGIPINDFFGSVPKS